MIRGRDDPHLMLYSHRIFTAPRDRRTKSTPNIREFSPGYHRATFVSRRCLARNDPLRNCGDYTTKVRRCGAGRIPAFSMTSATSHAQRRPTIKSKIFPDCLFAIRSKLWHSHIDLIAQRQHNETPHPIRSASHAGHTARLSTREEWLLDSRRFASVQWRSTRIHLATL